MANFTTFFNNWLTKQESLLQELESLITRLNNGDFNNRNNQECREIIPRVLSHYQELYQEKAHLANTDVFTLLSSPWLTSFERTFLWISGFRPSMLFSIIENSVAAAEEFSGEQRRKLEAARAEARRREREVTQGMARVQETVAEPRVYGLMRRFGRLVDGEVGEFEAAMEELKAAMAAVVGNADELRGATAAKVVEILNPVQNVRFLAGVMRFHLRARKWGLENDSRRESMGRS